MVDGVNGAVVCLHLRYLKARWNGLIQDVPDEGQRQVDAKVIGEPTTIHLDLCESTVEFSKLSLVIIKSLSLRYFPC